MSRQDPAGKSFDVVIVGSGASGGWVAKRLSEAGLRVAVLEAGRQLTDADYKEHVPAFQLKYRGRTKRPLEPDRPRQSASYAVREWNAGLVRQRHRRAVRRRIRSRVPLGADAARRRPHQHLGTCVPAAQRHRFQGRVARRRRRRLADRLQGHRALLRPRRGLRRRLGDGGVARRTAGREVPAGDGADVLRDGGSRATEEDIRADAHAGPHRQPDASAEQPAAVPLLRSLRAWLRDAFLFQRGVHDDGGCRGDGAVHARDRSDGLPGPRRSRDAPCEGHPLRRSRHPPAPRDLRPRRRAVRADAWSRCASCSTRRAARTRRGWRTRAACSANT